MTVFPLIEQYRAELRAQPYARLDDAALAEMRRSFANSHHSNAIEGIHPTPELEALFAMFVEERTPSDVLGPYVDRYIWDRIVPADRALRQAKVA